MSLGCRLPIKPRQLVVDENIEHSTASGALPERGTATLDTLAPLPPHRTAGGYLNESDAATYLSSNLPFGISARTLRRYRTDPSYRGLGPDVERMIRGRVWYQPKKLDKWIEKQTNMKAA